MRADPELTIETALADPVIRAAVRADHVSSSAFEALLRATARQLDRARSPLGPAQHVPARGARALEGHCGA